MEPINTNTTVTQSTNLNTGTTQSLDSVVATLANNSQTSSQSGYTSILEQAVLDNFYQGLSTISSNTAPAISAFLNQFSQQQASQGQPLSIRKQQTLLQYSMNQLNQTEHKDAALFQAIQQTLMGTFVTNMMLTQYMRNIFNKNREDSRW